MESKRTADSAARNDLPEASNRTSMESKQYQVKATDCFAGASNRTSMESKRMTRQFSMSILLTSNRTSMESKHSCSYQLDIRVILLIEPVWNRNAVLTHTKAFFDQFLLIEPVWNRNLHIIQHKRVRSKSSNRTSMESKRHKSPGSIKTGASLLIEPVWNRNTNNIWGADAGDAF